MAIMMWACWTSVKFGALKQTPNSCRLHDGLPALRLCHTACEAYEPSLAEQHALREQTISGPVASPHTSGTHVRVDATIVNDNTNHPAHTESSIMGMPNSKVSSSAPPDRCGRCR